MVLYARGIVDKLSLSTSASSSVLEGAMVMKDSKHGFAIIGSTRSPQGIITEWDTICKAVAGGRDPALATMGKIITANLLRVDSGTTLSSVSQITMEMGVRRLLVKGGVG
jgi:CBS domain-containing protein